jgi:hypothetical protein
MALVIAARRAACFWGLFVWLGYSVIVFLNVMCVSFMLFSFLPCHHMYHIIFSHLGFGSECRLILKNGHDAGRREVRTPQFNRAGSKAGAAGPPITFG